MEHGTTRTDYRDDDVAQMVAGLLTVASVLGDDLMREVVVVGGLVPRLRDLAADAPKHPSATHVGTRDLDLAIELSVFEDQRYASIAERLKAAGAAPRTNSKDNGDVTIRHAQWRLTGPAGAFVDIDFVIGQPDPERRKGGSVKHFGHDLGAFVMDAVALAGADAVDVVLEAKNLSGALAKHTVRVAGWASFVVMKAFALANRAKLKDNYDLCWVLEAVGPHEVAVLLRALPNNGNIKQEALAILARKFASANHEGPRGVVEFEAGRGAVDDARAADVFAVVDRFLQRAKGEEPSAPG